tara:strand:+ start:1962 stop:2372 length:411 start_codon:yes stop_codon:yes gene_type:complete
MAETQLYVFNVNARWRNRDSGKRVEASPGNVVEFDAGDFDELGVGAQGALVGPIAALIERELIRPFDPAKAGDPEEMSRDELLHVLRKHGFTSEQVPHNADAGQLRPMVVDVQEKAAKDSSGKTGGRKRRTSGGGG